MASRKLISREEYLQRRDRVVINIPSSPDSDGDSPDLDLVERVRANKKTSEIVCTAQSNDSTYYMDETNDSIDVTRSRWLKKDLATTKSSASDTTNDLIEHLEDTSSSEDFTKDPEGWIEDPSWEEAVEESEARAWWYRISGRGRREDDSDNLPILDNYLLYIDVTQKDGFGQRLYELTDNLPKTNPVLACGTIHYEKDEISVINIPIDAFSIGNLQISDREVKVWVGRNNGKEPEIWYRLGQPHSAYRDLHSRFMWKAIFFKHVLNWLEVDECANMDGFRRGGSFGLFLHRHHGQCSALETWLDRVKPTQFDFRSNAVRFANFLFFQINSVNPSLMERPLFAEQTFSATSLNWDNIHLTQTTDAEEKTVVLPVSLKYFQPVFGDILELVQPDAEFSDSSIEIVLPSRMHKKRRIYCEEEEFSCESIQFSRRRGEKDCRRRESNGVISERHYWEVEIDDVSIVIGDVVQVKASDEKNKWTKAGGIWCGIVLELFEIMDKNSIIYGEYFRILWLYEWRQTICRNLYGVKYNDKELFYSHHCECDMKAGQPVNSIIRKIDVNFGATEAIGGRHRYFCNRFYDNIRSTLETLKMEHRYLDDRYTLRCNCTKKSIQPLSLESFLASLQCGNGVIVHKNSRSAIYSIENIVPATETLCLREFFRLDDKVGNKTKGLTLPNELVISDHIVVLSGDKLRRAINFIIKCHIEFWDPTTPMPTNIQHKGAGNHCFFNKRLNNDADSAVPISEEEYEHFFKLFPSFVSQNPSFTKLRMLDLFCGGGSFGYGIEDAGVVECAWAVDIEPFALATKMRNNQSNTKPLLGSANLFLKEAILGKDNGYPKPGEVDIIVSGNPCQGFSLVNKFKTTANSVRKSSLLASLAAHIEYFRPRFFLMENVPNLANFSYGINVEEGEDIEIYPISHFMAFVWELGYQVRSEILLATNYGCPQMRSRLFVWGAARGEILPLMPPITHYSQVRNMHKGILLAHGERSEAFQETRCTVFKEITIEDAIGDLPQIGDGKKWSFRFPDQHVIQVRPWQQAIIQLIPPESSLRQIYDQLKNHPALKYAWVKRWASRWKTHRQTQNFTDFSRVRRYGLFGTITTRISPYTFHKAASLHYCEPRLVSVRECARAQDSDIFEGDINEQMKVIGNAVPRPIAFALGLELRRALETNESKMKK